MPSNIQSAPAYGVYASPLIRYARCRPNYSDLLSRHWALETRFLSQGSELIVCPTHLTNSRADTTGLVRQYQINVCQMFTDSIS